MLSDWLTLYHSHALTPGDWPRLLSRFDSPDGVLGASTSELQTCGLDRADAERLLSAAVSDSPVQALVAADQEWCSQAREHHIVTLVDDEYPEQLKEIRPAPPVLYLRGDRNCLRSDQVAVVGSRKASAYGREQATELSAGLARNGITVTSGLAQGIDASAHRGALLAKGKTIAVLGNGIDVTFPAANGGLYREIADQGLLLSEFARGTPPRPEQFPRRNRVISGLSRGVVVVEGTVRSGSLITARLAMEQNREVLAVPGSVRNPQSRGCHQLLREGAALAESARDVLVQTGLTGESGPVQGVMFRPSSSPALPGELQRVLDQVDDDPVPIDQLVQRTGSSLATLSRVLLQLEILGRISRNARGYRRQGSSAG